MNKRSILHYEIIDKPFNSETYKNFISSLMQHLSAIGLKNQVLIMDNASIHKNKEMLKLVTEINGHEMYFLPPYSPQLNPIEEVFSKWKCLIKSKNCRTNLELRNEIGKGSIEISASDCTSYFNHMKQFVMKIFKINVSMFLYFVSLS